MGHREAPGPCTGLIPSSTAQTCSLHAPRSWLCPHSLDPHSIPFSPSSLGVSLTVLIVLPVLAYDLILPGSALTAPLCLLGS